MKQVAVNRSRSRGVGQILQHQTSSASVLRGKMWTSCKHIKQTFIEKSTRKSMIMTTLELQHSWLKEDVVKCPRRRPSTKTHLGTDQRRHADSYPATSLPRQVRFL